MRYFGLFCCLALLAGCDAPQPSSSPSTAPPEPKSTSVVAPPPPSSRWEVEVKVSLLDKSRQVVISDHEFVLRCGKSVEGYVLPYIPSLGNSLDANDGYGQMVRYKLNDGAVQRARWSVSDDFKALFIPVPQLKKVIAAQSMVLEFKPSYVTAQTQTFDLHGLHDEAVKAGCKT